MTLKDLVSSLSQIRIKGDNNHVQIRNTKSQETADDVLSAIADYYEDCAT